MRRRPGGASSYDAADHAVHPASVSWVVRQSVCRGIEACVLVLVLLFYPEIQTQLGLNLLLVAGPDKWCRDVRPPEDGMRPRVPNRIRIRIRIQKERAANGAALAR